MTSLRGKAALITGGAKRIGRSCALALEAQGVELIIHYNNSKKEAHRLVDLIRQRGGKAHALGGDLSKEEDIQSLLSKIQTLENGPKTLDFLINSASIYQRDILGEATLAQLELNNRVNALAPLHLSQEFYKVSNKGGCIINFLDSRMVDYDRAHLSYHLSKRNLLSITKAQSLEYAPHLRVNAIAPGLILPPPGGSNDFLTKRIKTTPLEQIGTLEQINQTLIFLLTNSFITGQVIYVDGGRHLKGSVYGSL